MSSLTDSVTTSLHSSIRIVALVDASTSALSGESRLRKQTVGYVSNIDVETIIERSQKAGILATRYTDSYTVLWYGYTAQVRQLLHAWKYGFPSDRRAQSPLLSTIGKLKKLRPSS